MIYQIVAVRDRAANIFMRPFVVTHLGQAIRSFADEINRGGQDNTVAAHPEDFDLYHLGTYNDDLGELTPCKPHQIAIGHQLKKGNGHA